MFVSVFESAGDFAAETPDMQECL